MVSAKVMIIAQQPSIEVQLLSRSVYIDYNIAISNNRVDKIFYFLLTLFFDFSDIILFFAENYTII